MADGSFHDLLGVQPTPEGEVRSRSLSARDNFYDLLTGLGLPPREASVITNRLDENMLGNIFVTGAGIVSGMGSSFLRSAGEGGMMALGDAPLDPNKITYIALNTGLFSSLISRPGLLGMGGKFNPPKPPGEGGNVVPFKKPMTSAELFEDAVFKQKMGKAVSELDKAMDEAGFAKKGSEETGVKFVDKPKSEYKLEQETRPDTKRDIFWSYPDPKSKALVYTFRDSNNEPRGHIVIDSIKDGVARIGDIIVYGFKDSGDKHGLRLGTKAMLDLKNQLLERHPEINQFSARRDSGARGFIDQPEITVKVPDDRTKLVVDKAGTFQEEPLLLTKAMQDQATFIENYKQAGLKVVPWRKRGLLSLYTNDHKKRVSPYFETSEELYKWFAENYGKKK